MNARQVGITLLAPLAGAVALAVRWSALPDRVATHWGASGTPDGFTGKGIGLVLMDIGVPLAVTLLLVVVLLTVPRHIPFASGAHALAPAIGWFITVITVTSTVLQRSSATGETTGVSGWTLSAILAGALVASVAAGFAAYRVRTPAAPLPPRQGSLPPDAPLLEAATAGSTVGWNGVARCTLPLRAALAALLVVGVALTVIPPLVGAPALILAGLIVAVTAALSIAALAVDVTIGAQAVVAVARLRWPRLRVPLGEIDHAAATTTGIWRWGGWGLRYSRGDTGIITRAGEALDIVRTDGHHLIVTVDDAERAAETLNTLIASARAVAD